MPGIFTYQQLRTAGYSRRAINHLVHSGVLSRFSRGWFADQTADQAEVRTIASGGRLTCISACRLFPLWTPPAASDCLHIAYHPRRGNIKMPAQAVCHRQFFAADQVRLDLPEIISIVFRCCSSETSLIIAESAVNNRLLSVDEVSVLIEQLPTRTHNKLLSFSPSAQSGSETRVRIFLENHNFSVIPQAYIPEVGFVDFLVDQRTVIECDGRQYHVSESTFENDHRRDLAAQDAGYRVVRLSYRQIWYEWSQTQQKLLTILRRR
ncbi:type IV toxin-antitoxin system AbiEi family antitoxin domain-containing protein [Arcanobacterium phocae]|uniref:type IV toxin-antitoxin system AbiEi family antitoxin domain-containing protein n=1 Tax=Arcanobacterium phocae TaxID=131112 RepID=UPI001C12066C|nr:type IV toxin-antitoxin system AbiEi family antitoxin domain-containing protein [Arcanobacterium phocae]